MDFQERLYTLRRRAGLSQEGLANQLGVTRQAVQKWEAGTARPDLENLVALARQFDVSLDYLVTGEESVPRPQAEPGCQRSYADPYVFEYKSKRTLFGIPLVHVRLGYRRPTVAKGIFAVGNVAVGVFTLGAISTGIFSFGGISLGLLLALGGLGIGGIALGGCAIGLIALGGAAIGIFSMGGGAVGMYAVGGGAFASKIAIGDSASGPLAIGRSAVSGAVTLRPDADPDVIRAAISQASPHLPQWIQDFFLSMAQLL